MADILVYSDSLNTAKELAFKGKEFAAALGMGISAAALGADADETAAQLGAFGADRVFVSKDAALEGLQTDLVADALAKIAKEADATYIMVGSTRRGKELAGRLAQKLGAGAVTDVNSVELEDGELVAARFKFGGATVARETVDTDIKVFAVMPKAFEIEDPVAGAGTVVTPDLSLTPSAVKLVETKPKEGAAVNLDAADRLVCIGRGLGAKDDLTIVEAFCTALGGELGCTKSLCDWEWLAENRLVGLSGAKTKPSLYISLGISGQVHHTVGISSSKVIVAVNKDDKALIFNHADYGIVGDIYDVIPVLTEAVKGK